MGDTSKLIFAAFTAIALAAPTRAAEPSLGAVDPEIRRVDTGGYWEGADLRGYYRTVVRTRCSDEHCYDTLFIQWMAEGAPPRLLATRYVTEVGDLTNVTQVKFILSPRGTRVEVRHEAHGTIKMVRCLSLGGEGKYAAQEGICKSAR